MSTARMKTVSYPMFDGHEYLKWKAMMKKRLMAINSELWTVTEIGLTIYARGQKLMTFASSLFSISQRRTSSAPVCLKINSGTSCILIMRNLSRTVSVKSMKVIELVMILGLSNSRNLSRR